MKRTGAVNTSSKGKKSLSFNQKKNKTKPKAVSQVHRPASKP